MLRHISALIAGLVFGLGLVISQMVNPAMGAILFGLGWGLVGLCPGPAIAALLIGGLPIVIFLGAMIGGMVMFEAFNRLQS